MRQLSTLIFAKAPLPGLAKTRLIPALGAEGAALLARRMLIHTVSEVLASGIGDVALWVTPDPAAEPWQEYCKSGWPVDWRAQGDGNLGDRLARAARCHMEAGRAVLLVGTDCPSLTAGVLREAATLLSRHDAVMIPSRDGGYVLLGLTQFHSSLFEGVAWSTPLVAEETRQRIFQKNWSLAELPPLSDIDEPGDLTALPQEWRYVL